MEANVSKYTNAIGSGKQAITQRQKRKGGRGMREGWEYKKLGDICTIERGGSPRPIADYITESADGINWIKIGDAVEESKYILFTKEKIRPEGIKKSRFVHKGDVILSNSMSFGKPYILGIDGCIHDGWLVLHDNNNTFNKDYLYYVLSSPIMYSKFTQLAVGGVVNNLNSNIVREVVVAIPPLSTQQSIVSELDKINELIRLKKEQLKDYDNLAQSIFYEMFGDPVVNEKGWEVKNLGEVAMIKTGPFGSMLHKEDYITGGIPLINPMHIQNFKAVPDKDFSISKEKAAELCNYQLKINDVIFARRGDIGRCAVISDKEAGCLCGTGSLFVRFERKLSSIYTMYVVRTTSFIKELVSKAKGATMLNLNSSTMENLRFPIPPLPLQQLFAQRIELIEKQKAEVQRTIADLETLLASRMQYWFG